jgi:hypothetical protein
MIRTTPFHERTSVISSSERASGADGGFLACVTLERLDLLIGLGRFGALLSRMAGIGSQYL